MRAVLIDSSAFLALADPDEPSHQAVRSAFEEYLVSGMTFLTTNFVFDETYTLILSRLDRSRAIEWGDRLKESQTIGLIRVDEDHEAAAWDILLAFADKDFSYTDATSFAVAKSLAIDEALSVDRHFHQYGSLRVLPDRSS